MFTKAFAVAAGCLAVLMSFDAGAVPVSPVPLAQHSLVTLIAGGCGPGWHRGPYGGCRRNFGPGGRRCWFQPTPYGPRRVCRW